ncbi:MAG: Type 1 glutamine amidotransferase-like domain-containing protein [Ornithinibacter sp.]
MTSDPRDRRRNTSRRSVRTAAALIAVSVVAATAALTASSAAGDEPTVLTPIGGGYESSTLAGFSRAAAEGASGPTVDLVVVPSAYGDSAKERAANLTLAQQRTDQLDAACDAAVPAGFIGCTATLAVLLNRADALDPANAAALAAPTTDGIYVLGGDQGLAMQVLAASPAEAAITAAVRRGAALGGTSAGAAVQSRTMINGYTRALDAPDGLQQGSTLVWWGDDADLERGLDVGSTRAIFDQHFYQRGRFGRTLSTLATADERFAGTSPVGVGVDYATGIRDTGDTVLSDLFGESSAAVVDLETLGATHSWVGSPATLSARRVLTHLMTDDTTYDLSNRTFSRAGSAVPAPSGAAWTPPASPSRVGGTVFLGGGVLDGDVVGDVITAARAVSTAKTARLVVLGGGSGSSSLVNAYGQAVKKAGWAGSVTTVVAGSKGWSTKSLAGATAVVLVAEDPAALASTMADQAFRDAVSTAVRTTPVVLADGAMTAVLGSRWSAKANAPEADLDAIEAEGVAAFRSDDAAWLPGLSLVRSTLVPHLADDYRWGRLYAGVTAAPGELAVGITAGSAVVLGPTGGSVSGRSVVVADGRGGTFWTGGNGAMGASGVVLDVFGEGEALHR